jgi:hypothetical protein
MATSLAISVQVSVQVAMLVAKWLTVAWFISVRRPRAQQGWMVVRRRERERQAPRRIRPYGVATATGREI